MDRTKWESFEEDYDFPPPIQVEPNKVQAHHHESLQICKGMVSPDLVDHWLPQKKVKVQGYSFP
jgi:hypothetical protein